MFCTWNEVLSLHILYMKQGFFLLNFFYMKLGYISSSFVHEMRLFLFKFCSWNEVIFPQILHEMRLFLINFAWNEVISLNILYMKWGYSSSSFFKWNEVIPLQVFLHEMRLFLFKFFYMKWGYSFSGFASGFPHKRKLSVQSYSFQFAMEQKSISLSAEPRDIKRV